MAIKQYSAFTPPSPYDQERRRAEQMRQYAELLQQQAMSQDEQPFTYQGFRAAPSPLTALTKMLQAYGAKKAGEKADEAEARKTGMEEQAAQQMMGRLTGAESLFGRDEQGGMTSVYEPIEKQRAQIDADIERQRASGQLEEVRPTAQYTRDPMDAARIATTGAGAGAMRGNPMLAAMLQKSMERPAPEEFYAPTETEQGFVQFGKQGGKKDTGYKPVPKPVAGSSLSKLIAEREALPPDSPLIATYDAAIEKETTNQPPIALNLGEKGDVEAQKIFLKDIGELRPQAYAARNIIRAVNNLDRLTEEGTYTGALAPTAVGASQFLNSIGIKIDPKVLENTEAFAAQSSDLVLSAQAALGGARGFTKEETAILMQMFPQVINSPQARITIGNIIRNKQLDVIDEYDSLITDYENTYKDSKIPYKKMDDEEVRYQRWKRAQRNR